MHRSTLHENKLSFQKPVRTRNDPKAGHLQYGMNWSRSDNKTLWCFAFASLLRWGAQTTAQNIFWRDQAPLLSLSGFSSPSLHFQVKIAPRDRFLDLGVSRVARRMYSRWNLARKLERFYEHGRCAQRFYSQALVGINQLETRPKVHYSHHILCGLHDVSYQVHPHRSFRSVEDPFSLVADELSLIAKNLREQVAEEIHKKAPKLASAAKYFFERAEGKKFRPTVLLHMASALNMPISQSTAEGVFNTLSEGLRARQQSVAKITEMIHVASLLHDDVLDDADKRRGVESLNFIMGNKLAVLAGDFLLSKACVALADLKNTEVVGLIAKVVENLVTGETMQMATTSEQRRSMEYYLEKTYCKTASLISNSCKSVAILAGQTAEVSTLAYEYGRNLGLAYQLTDDILDFTGNKDVLGKGVLSDIRHGIVTAPILYAMEEFPQLVEVVDRGFDDPADVDLALEYLGKSRGIERARQLAEEHANRAKEAIEALPDSDDEDVLRSRSALINLTDRAIRRAK